MSTSTILILTILAVMLVLAVALLAGSLALLAGGVRQDDRDGGGLIAALRMLDRQWRIERLVYRHHRIFGTVVLLAGVFCIWQFTRSELAELLAAPSALSVLVWILLLGQGFNLLVGVFILLRPSVLKPLESLSNRWHGMDVETGQGPRRTRLAAVVLSLVGLLILLISATLLFQQITTLSA